MERLDLYKKYLDQLLAEGKAEKDFSHQENQDQIDENHYAIRFKAGGRKVQFNDLVFGRVEKEVEDFIIMKSSGIPTYHMAVVVDDHLMEISHVIRGQDHLSNTAKHVLLFEALGFTPPIYTHYSLTHGLSKRDQSKSIANLREKGYLPEAIINIAMLLGWSPPDEKEKFNIFDQLDAFELKDFSRVNANFDEKKFNWLAGQYIREADLERLLDLARPHLKSQGLIDESFEDKNYLKQVLEVVRGNLNCLSEIGDQGDFFFQDVNYKDEAREILTKEDSKRVLEGFRELLAESDSLTSDQFKSFLKTVQKDTKIKGKGLFMPVRVALTGKLHGPEMFLVAPILGKALCISRLDQAIHIVN